MQRIADQSKVTLDEALVGYHDMPVPVGDEPFQVQYLYDIWGNLSMTKNADTPLSYLDMKAYCDMNGLDLEPWETEIIFSIDQAWGEQYAKERERYREK